MKIVPVDLHAYILARKFEDDTDLRLNCFLGVDRRYQGDVTENSFSDTGRYGYCFGHHTIFIEVTVQKSTSRVDASIAVVDWATMRRKVFSVGTEPFLSFVPPGVEENEELYL